MATYGHSLSHNDGSIKTGSPTYPSQKYDMATVLVSHQRKSGFDDIDVSEVIRLELITDEGGRSVGSSKLFDRANDG